MREKEKEELFGKSSPSAGEEGAGEICDLRGRVALQKAADMIQ